MPGISGGVAVAPQAPPQPTLTIETELPDQDEYEVRIYDERHGRRLVAAIELISPANKVRPESRRAFVGKVAALLQGNVCVSLVDVVTIREFNLYADVLEFIGGNDPALETKGAINEGRLPFKAMLCYTLWHGQETQSIQEVADQATCVPSSGIGTEGDCASSRSPLRTNSWDPCRSPRSRLAGGQHCHGRGPLGSRPRHR
jgi:hypothetical protein